MLMDQPDVPLRTEILRRFAVYSALLTPLVWLVSLILAVVETRRRKRQRLLRIYTVAPYAAAGFHVFTLVALFTFAK